MARHSALALAALPLLLGCPQEIAVQLEAGTGSEDARETRADSGPLPDGSSPADSGPADSGPGDASGLDAFASDVCQGPCLDSCALGSSVCTGDGFGFQGCGFNPITGFDDLGARVACGAADPCVSGSCARTRCPGTELLVVLDRSASMSVNSTWNWVRDVLVGAIGIYDQANLFGLRQFPTTACTPGTAMAPQAITAQAFRAALLDPSAEASSPIEMALTGLAGSFGPARDGQAVLLLSDGGESCGTGDGAVRAASVLHRRGVRVYTVAIHTTADRSLLDRIAEAGGTRKSRFADDELTLTATLATVVSEAGACRDPHAQVSAGLYHTCGIGVDGTLTCWGRDLSGESTPPAGRFSHLAAGGGHTCAVRVTGEVVCWGRNDRLQLDSPAGSFVEVASGDQHSCARRQDGTVACWGYNDVNQANPPSGAFKAITCGGFFSCGIRPNDRVECWGQGAIRPTEAVRAIDGGSFHMCAILTDGSLWCSSMITPGPFAGISAGDNHDCAVRTDGTLFCRGANHVGQSDPPTLGRYAAVTAEYEHSCAVQEWDDRWVCWGSNSNGQATPPP